MNLREVAYCKRRLWFWDSNLRCTLLSQPGYSNPAPTSGDYNHYAPCCPESCPIPRAFKWISAVKDSDLDEIRNITRGL